MPVAGFANKSVIGKIKQRVEENRKDLQQDKENEKEKITQAGGSNLRGGASE